MEKNRGHRFEDAVANFYQVAKSDRFPTDSFQESPDMILPDGRKVQAKAYRGTVSVPPTVATYKKVEDYEISEVADEIYKAVRWWLDNEAADYFALETGNKEPFSWVILTKEEMNRLTATPTQCFLMFGITQKEGKPQLQGKSWKKELKRYKKRFETQK